MLGTRRKRTEVADAVETIVATEEKNEVAKEAAKLTHTAFGTFRDESSGEWMVAEMRYNPVTSELGDFKVHSGGPTRDFAIEKFKLLAVREGVVG